MTRDDALALDAADPLAPLREQFALPAGVIYLDGNSLGVLPQGHRRARAAGGDATNGAADLIRSWNTAGWIDLPQRIGDKIARLVGAARRRAGGRRLDLGQPVQGAERRARHRAGGRRRSAA